MWVDCVLCRSQKKQCADFIPGHQLKKCVVWSGSRCCDDSRERRDLADSLEGSVVHVATAFEAETRKLAQTSQLPQALAADLQHIRDFPHRYNKCGSSP